MKILVADDSKTNLAILINSLTKLGHEVIAANNGLEAIQYFKKQRPDLVILDVVMEEMDGFECAKHIREFNTDDWIPIIFLSGAVDDENISKGINAGGDDYLTKPFSEVTLAAKIKAMQRISDMRKKLCATTQKLSVLSSIDPVTSVYNRLEFDKKIIEQTDLAGQSKEAIALLFIDIDHFKKINDNLGHHVGDFILREVASRIASCIRVDDILARLGGDEFSIILPNISAPEKAGQVAQKIIETLKPSYKISGHEIFISCSIGIACFPSPGIDLDTIVQKADIAMYHAKDLGRNNYQFYTAELDKKHTQRTVLENALKEALHKQELFISYQPIFNLKTKKITGIESLLRWKHPEIGLVLPDTFLPLAEESGLITLIGEKMLEKICLQGAQWHQAGHRNFKLIVNLSSRQLLQKSLPEILRSTLEKTKLPPGILELEITESTLMAHVIHSEQVLHEISKLEITISIDDFGTGYSSLGYLKNLPVRSLKIDKSFIRDLNINQNANIIVKALINLGLNLGLQVIAEGIENKEQYKFLIENHCLEGQGFYLGKPASAEQMTKLLNKKEPVAAL